MRDDERTVSERGISEFGVGEPGADASARNQFSGKAQAAAQARTVFGGIHLHTPSRRGPRPWWLVLSVVAGVASLNVVVDVVVSAHFAKEPENHPIVAEPVSVVAHYTVPDRLNRATGQLRREIPESVGVHTFLGYQCGGEIRWRAALSETEVPRGRMSAAATATRFGDKIMKNLLRRDEHVNYGPPKRVSRLSYDGAATYPGVEIDGVFPVADDGCGGGRGVLGVLVLDHGDRYLVCVVSATLGGDPVCVSAPAEEDVRVLLDSVRPVS
ncbi:hypothetical protein [Amycolatopsis sp. NPDC059021]|uniref:hypothetical protein n=1 Tax=Amycolatopsis sp. NPDC059021 TaxID=3346704 RepID=UPI003672B8C6